MLSYIKKNKLFVFLIIVVAISVVAYNMYDEFVVKGNNVFEPIANEFEVDINSQFDYDITKYIRVKHGDPEKVFANMVSTIDNVATHEINEFYVVVRHENEKKGFWVNVVDRQAPTCLPRRTVTYTTDQQFNIMDFVYDYADESPVKFYVMDHPNFALDFLGEKVITLVCEDNSGNRTYNPELIVKVVQGNSVLNAAGSAATTKPVTAPPKPTTNDPTTTPVKGSTTPVTTVMPAPSTTKPVIIPPEQATKTTTTQPPLVSVSDGNDKYKLRDYFTYKPSEIALGSEFEIWDDLQVVLENKRVYANYVRGDVDTSKEGIYDIVYGITYKGVYSETIYQYQVYKPKKPDPTQLYLWDSTYGDKTCKWTVEQSCKQIVIEKGMQIPAIKIEGASNDMNGMRLKGYNANGGETTGLAPGENVFYVIWNYNQEVLGKIVVDARFKAFE